MDKIFYRCTYCGNTFPMFEYMNSHLRNHHNEPMEVRRERFLELRNDPHINSENWELILP